MGLKEKLHNIKGKVEGTKWQTMFGAIHTLFYTPNETTHLLHLLFQHIPRGCFLKSTTNTPINS